MIPSDTRMLYAKKLRVIGEFEGDGIFIVSMPDRSRNLLNFRIATEAGVFCSQQVASQAVPDMKIGSATPKANNCADSTGVVEADCLLRLLHDCKDISCDIRNDDARISIKEQLPSGIVRLLWSIALPRLNEAAKAYKALANLASDLLERGDYLESQFTKARLNIVKVEAERNDWKETAEQLEGAWDSEKSELLSNFCTLYEEKELHMRKHTQSLKQEVEKLRLELAESKPKATSKATYELPECLQKVPDDHDQSLYDEETVDRLASGASSLPKKRRNEISGAIEYFCADAALEDMTSSKEKTKKRKTSAKKRVEEKNNAASRQHTGNSRSIESGSETGSESDFAFDKDDKDLQAEILASMKALQK